MIRIFFPLFLICVCPFGILYSGIENHYKRIENKTDGHSFGSIDFVYLINLDHRTGKWKDCVEELVPHGIKPFRFSAVNGWKIQHQALQEIGMRFHPSMRGGGMGSIFLWDDGKEYQSHELVRKAGQTYFCHCLSRGSIGCLMSHVSIMKDAYNSGYELVWIMEDDIEAVRDPSLLLSYIDELDHLIGRGNWDLLYTDRDYRSNDGGYILSFGTDYRPDVETRNQEKFNIDKKISKNLRRMGSRFGTHSMIWSRSGLKKYLEHIEKHGMFLPIDMDIHLARGIKIYSVLEDVVTNKLNVISDNAENGS
jgi:GR25 family glycosyltransferase involved in LPS biosynthesis